jgi:vancomycin resistance protein YoaR
MPILGHVDFCLLALEVRERRRISATIMNEAVAPRPNVPERIGRRLRALAKAIAARDLRKISLIFTLLAGALPGILGEFADENQVRRGVRVLERDVSELDRRALAEMLEKRAQELERRPLAVRVFAKPLALEPSALAFRVDVKTTVERALAAGRSGGFFSRFTGAYRRWFVPETVELAAALDASKLRAILAGWDETAVPERPFAGAIAVAGTNVEARKPHGGWRLDAAAAERAIGRALVEANPGTLELPVVRVPAPLPETAADAPARMARSLVLGPITLVATAPPFRAVLAPEEIGAALGTVARSPALELVFVPERLEAMFADERKALELDAVDAKFEIDPKGTIRVLASRDGLRIDLARVGAALLAAAQKTDRTGELPLLAEPKPALTTEEAEHLGIKGLVSSFTTRHPCCEKRVENIHRIADIMNGRVVRPGETVSVNAVVGPRTAKNGFVLAPTIEEGEMVDSLGGGISQFATTLFNALFHGGYDIVERQPHTYWFPRYPMGHEATLSWPKPDIIFKNDTAAGMVFVTSYTGMSITVKIYGDNGGRKVRAQVSGRQNVIEPTVEILPNAKVSPDEEQTKEPGSVGWSVIVSRFVTFPDGPTREDRRRVTYKPRPKRIEVHPCRIPKGDKGYTGERCPEPEDVEELPAEP